MQTSVFATALTGGDPRAGFAVVDTATREFTIYRVEYPIAKAQARILAEGLPDVLAQRLARTLLLLSRYGEPEASHRALPPLSQETLAEMVGTTRSRVSHFMNKFRKLGFIDYSDNGGLTVQSGLLSVVLHD